MLSSLHIIVDSKEQSISAVRCHEPLSPKPGVTHIQHADFAKEFLKLFRKKKPKDKILISMDFIENDVLENASAELPADLKETKEKYPRVTLISYGCFDHIKGWCNKHGFVFTENPYERRVLKKEAREIISKYIASGDEIMEPDDSQKISKARKILEAQEIQKAQNILERIWVQYRLMRAIISNSEPLSDVAKQLIMGEPMLDNSMKDKYRRAFEYFKLGEPDMVGGTYFKKGKKGKEEKQGNLIDQLRERIRKIAATDHNVLIQGESGSGKETVAWAIHELSERRNKHFFTLNCSGFSDVLLESELFGYIQGAHSTANEDKAGILKKADGGTVFLDELPDLGARVQAKLLRLLESGEYRPVGAAENEYVNIRIIGAGQGRLLNKRKRIRPDLIARIAKVTVELSPLREIVKNSQEIFFKIVYALLERQTWKTVYRNGVHKLTPKDIRDRRNMLENDEEKRRLLTGADWQESNVRQLDSLICHWLTIDDDEFSQFFQRSTRSSKKQNQTVDASNSPKAIDYGDFAPYLAPITSLKDLKGIFEGDFVKNLERAYVRYIYQYYLKIENGRKTRKELAELINIDERKLGQYVK